MGLTRLACIAALICAALSGAAPIATAQDYPTRPVRLVVAFPAGGPVDLVGRILADRLKPLLHQNVLIDNRPGANGAIGAEQVAKSEPDGHTLFLTTVGAVAITPNLRTDTPYDPIRDFAPITQVVRNTTILVINPSVTARSAKEFAERARADPGRISIASTGVGSIPHLAQELFQAAANVKFLHVPYRGAAPAITDLLGGQVQGLFADAAVLMPHIQSGKLIPIAVAANERIASLPDTPTLAEEGFAGADAENWYGLFAPAKTPRPIIDKLNQAMLVALKDPETSGKLIKAGAIPAPSSPEELGKLLASELERWGRIIREKDIKGGS